jgi:glycerophosphoryl diester phosphodiesterase
MREHDECFVVGDEWGEELSGQPSASKVEALSIPWNVREHVQLKDFVVQAHRGAGVLAEENTLAAFQLGWRLGCVPEADVRTTRDGVIVAHHDALTPETKNLTRMAEVFALMTGQPQRRLYLDIKDVELNQLAAEVRGADVEQQVILASTKYPAIRAWMRISPQSQTLLWMGGAEPELEKRFAELRASEFADVMQLQIHTHVRENGELMESEAFLIEKGREVRSRGILLQTLPYGGTTKEVYWKLMDLGFMSFATDHPDVTWDAIKSYYAEGK